jgi:CheY-like chemotaxis protein
MKNEKRSKTQLRRLFLSLLFPLLIINCAENGLEAVDIITASPTQYDMILMDVQIIAMTAHVFKSDIEECLAAGMDDHVGKPLDIDDILKKLQEYLV